MFSTYIKDYKNELLVAGTVVGASFLYHKISKLRTVQRKYAIREGLRSKRDGEIEALRQETRAAGVSPDNEIVRLSLEQLTQRLQSGELKAVDVLKAYQAKAVQVHDRTNCLTGRILEAEERAELLDRQEGEKGPLHGVPVSIKDSVALVGYLNTWGCANKTSAPESDDAVLVKLLLDAGAVPFVRTNIPQVLLAFESSNLIYGPVGNFTDPSRGSGGSSGGEGSLIAGGGAVIGVGSDIGGSIRQPASFSGICGLKPGTSRVSNVTASPPRGQTVVLPTSGPMTRDVESLVTMMKCFLTPRAYDLDPMTPMIPFKDEVYRSSKPLRIGWYVDDGYYPAVPAMARAVKVARDALEKAGHTLVPWQPVDVQDVYSTFTDAIVGDGGTTLWPLFKDDVIDPSLKLFYSFLYTSSFVRKVKSWYYHMVGKHKLAYMMEHFGGFSTVAKWWALTTHAELYRRRFVAKWKEHQLDAVIYPGFAVAATKLGSSSKLIQMGNYTFLWNVLDFPAGTVPVTKVTKEDVSALSGYSTGDYLTEWVRKDQAESEGLPVCVQVASLRWQEELVLRVMKEIQDRVNYQ